MIKKIFMALGLGLIASVTSELLLKGIQFSVNQISKTSIWFVFPLLGAVIITIIRKNFLGNNKSFGLDEIADEMENIEFKIMDLRDTIVKTILTFTTLVFGFSAGKFGPLIHIGGSLGSKLSYHLNYDEEDIRYFIATGVAASLAGFFSSPLFGLFFIVEILLKYRINYRIIYPVIGVVSTIVVSEFVNNNNFFEIMHNQIILSTKNLFISLIIIGIVTGIIASIYKAILIKSKKFIKEKERWYFPLLGGAIISIIGFFYPLNFDLYIDLNSIVINKEIAIQAAIILLLLKLLTTGITFALGGMGGGFAPAIYIGILAGYITSNFIYIGNCANILGMVGMMAGYSNAPIATAILFTGIMGDFSLFIPFLILGIISSSINKNLRKKAQTYIIKEKY